MAREAKREDSSDADGSAEEAALVEQEDDDIPLARTV
jgi:hypothetical protein